MYLTYDFCLFEPLKLAVFAASIQLVLAFLPRFSLTILGNALLFTVFVPLATNQLKLGTEVGWWLWLGNLTFLVLLVARWTKRNNTVLEGLPLLVSLLGLMAFGLHVFFFSACP